MLKDSTTRLHLMVGGLATLVLLTTTNALFSRFSKDALLKQRIHRGYLAAFALVFCLTAWVATHQILGLVAGLFTVGFYVITQLRLVAFCNRCGATLYARSWGLKNRACRGCGERV